MLSAEEEAESGGSLSLSSVGRTLSLVNCDGGRGPEEEEQEETAVVDKFICFVEDGSFEVLFFNIKTFT